MRKLYLTLTSIVICYSVLSQNPQMLKDVFPGANSGTIQNIVKTTGYTFFNEDDDDPDTEKSLFRTDGTSAGTIKLNLTYPGYLSVKAEKLTALGDKIIFAGNNFVPNYGEIWVSDGTQAGTMGIELFQSTIPSGTGPIFDLVEMNGFVYYTVIASNNKLQLRKTDGTVAGTSLVYEFPHTTHPEGAVMRAINGTLYFDVFDRFGSGSDAIWRSDGTETGTYMLRDLGSEYVLAGSFMPVNNKVCFMTGRISNNNSVLFVTDGTDVNTVPLYEFSANINTNRSPSNAAIANTLYFTANNGATNGKELWKTDGTSAGTMLAVDLVAGSASSNPNFLTALNNVLYFNAFTPDYGNELWKFDGSVASLVKDINPGINGSGPGGLKVSGNTIVFAANNGANGGELWITDGTTKNTLMVADINPSGNSVPNTFTNGNPVYFAANNGANGFEVYKYDNNGNIIGGPHRFYVNDNSQAADVFTTGIGNNINNGSKQYPFATIDYALTQVSAGDTILVDAGTYTTGNMVINKSITILGANYLLTPNNETDPLQLNSNRNAESIISNSSFTIGASDINFSGFSFDPQANSQFIQTNNSVEYDNITLAKNIFRINSASPVINIMGKQALPLATNNYDINDNRFIKEDASISPSSNCIVINSIDGYQVRNNTFTVSAIANARKQTAIFFEPAFRSDNVSVTNNTAYQVDRFVAGGNVKRLTVQFNKTIEDNRFFVSNNTINDPIDFTVSDNTITDDKTNATSIGYSRNNGFDLSTPNIFRAERNIITINPNGTNFCPQALIAPTVNPNTPDVRVFINDNKLKFLGSFIAFPGLSVNGIRLWQNINQATIQNNEISFEGTDVTTNSTILGVTLLHQGLQPGTNYQILNNKVSGFKTSLSIQLYQGAAGNLPEGVSVEVHNNSFTGDIVSIDNGTTSQEIQASCNWFGSSADQDFINKVQTLGTVNVVPWLTDGTDADPGTGFQSLPGACDNGNPPLVLLNGYTNVTCNGANNGTISTSTTYGKAPFIFTWTKDGDPEFVSHDEDPSNLSPGIYHLAVTDGNGSTIYITDPEANGPGTIDVTITEPSILTASANGTNTSCNAGNNGSATVNAEGGTAPYSYLWSNNETTQSISNLTAGIYTVTVTDANGCTTQSNYEVTQPEQVSVIPSGADVNCFGGADGSIQLNVSGGVGSYSYLWNNGATTSSLSGISASTYTVTVTDANGCTAQANYEVKQPSELTISVTGTTASCNGSATANPSGGTAPYSYLWNTGATTQSIINVPAGTYSVIVTDSHNCSASGSFTITGGSSINPTISLVQVSCFGAADGSITITGTNNGIAPFTYNLNGSSFQASNVFNGLSAGVYIVGVKDANGCSDFVSKTIAQPDVLTVALDSLRKPCNGSNNGRIYITAKDGNTGKSFSWTGPNSYSSTSQNLAKVSAGIYNVTVTDSKGCSATLQVDLSEWPAINITEGITDVVCNGDFSGAIDATVSGGTGEGFGILWKGPNGFTASTEDITGLSAGNYKLTVTDVGSGCSLQKTITVQQFGNLTLSTTKTNVTGCSSLGSITTTSSGGKLPHQYSLDGITYQESGNFTGLEGGTYTVWVKDANGCTNSKTLNVTDLGKDEFEGNNSKGQAKTIIVGNIISARIATATDVADWFKFTTDAAGSYYITLTHPSASFIFDVYPSGNGAALTPVSSSSSAKAYNLAANTTYTIKITGGLSFTCYQLSIANEISTRSIDNIMVQEISNSENQNFNVFAYPNPAGSYFNLKVTALSNEKMSLRIMDISGRLIEEKQNILPYQVLRIGDKYIKGVYMAEIIQGQKRKVIKLVKL